MITNRNDKKGKPKLMIGGLVRNLANTDIISLYSADPYKPKTQLLIEKSEKVGKNYFKHLKFFIEYSLDMERFLLKY